MKPPFVHALTVDEIRRTCCAEAEHYEGAVGQLPRGEHRKPTIYAEPRRIFVSAGHARRKSGGSREFRRNPEMRLQPRDKLDEPGLAMHTLEITYAT